MQTTFAIAAIAAVAYAAPQGVAVTADISPTGSAPAGFSTTFANPFQITAVNTTIVVAKRDIAKRGACPSAAGSLVITLTDGKLTDETGRTGYIASNFQFQFDKPPQAGAIFTDGFSVGSNSSLALGSSAVFYECLSGSFFNLYDRKWAPQCEPILIDILPCDDSSSGAVTQATDGQPAATTVATAITQATDGQPAATGVATVLSDGQPEVSSAIVISQISDGQLQVLQTTSTPVPSSTQLSSAIAISQISDGQLQVPQTTLAPVPSSTQLSSAIAISQISDGQLQVPQTTSTPVPSSTQLSSAIPISQISDGQLQAPTTVAAMSTAAPTGVISQASAGRPQAPTNGTSVTTPTAPAAITASGGNAVTVGSSFIAMVVGLVAALL